MPMIALASPADIRALARRFQVPYNKDDPRNSLEAVCALVLNEYTDKEFKKLSYSEANRIAVLGEAITEGALYVGKKNNLPLDPRIRPLITELVSSGTIGNKEIFLALSKTDIHYDKMVVQVMTRSVRLAITGNASPKGNTRPLRTIVKEIMADGAGFIEQRHIVREVARLKVEGKEPIPEFSPRYLVRLIYDERKRLGFTKMAETKIRNDRMKLELSPKRP